MHIPVSLTRHIAEKRCILFVGAGLSAAAGLPTWGRLLEQVIEELESSGAPEAPDLRALWQARRYLEVADHCADARGALLRNVLTSTVRGATEPIPDVHKVLRELPFAGVVTTNYDKLLERAYWGTDRIPKVHTHMSKDAFGTLLFDRAFFILKAHGEIDEPDTIVLSTATYRELIHANPAFNAVMSAILLNFSVLFAGYSLNDPDFRLLLERQISDFKGSAPARYALLDGVGTVEAQILQRNVGIQVIPYPKGQHGEVLTFFQELRESVRKEEEKKGTAATVPAAATAAATAATPKKELTLRSVRSPAKKKLATARTQATLQLRLRGTEIEAGFTAEGRTVTGSVPFVAAAELPANVLAALEALGGTAALELDVDETLRPLPWELVSLGGHPLGLAMPVFRRAPSFRTALPAAAKVLVIGDPHENLPGAMQEAVEVAALYPDATFLKGRQATFSRVADLLAQRFDVVHFAGHAWTEQGEGRLYLADRTAIGARELRSFVSRNPPAVMFLNSHYTAFYPGGNVYAFAEMAASAGVGAFIGSFGSPTDEAARELGVAFHRFLREGAAATEALWRARSDVARKHRHDSTPLDYTGSGIGALRVEEGA